MVTGSCEYSFNPSEQYQHRELGTHCGRETFSGYEEIVTPEKQADGSVKEVTSLVQREQADPYCPLHGGTADPTKPVDAPVADDAPPVPPPVIGNLNVAPASDVHTSEVIPNA